MSDNSHPGDTRIAHVNLARGFRGGERQTQLLIGGLAERGFRQTLVARRGEPLAERCERIPGLKVAAVPNNILSAVAVLKDVDLVHIHEGRSIQAGYLNRKLRDVPYLVTRRLQKGPKNNGLTRAMYRQAASIVALSQAISTSMSRLDASLECEIVPDGTGWLHGDHDAIRDIRARAGGTFVFGHIGELDDSHKGQRQILAVARRFLGLAPGVKFVLVGSGRDENAFRQESRDLPNVQFMGRVDNVGDYLRAFDAFLFPSRHEGLGSILLDAMFCGLPIVATDVGGIPELLEHGLNALLCPVDDIEAMTCAATSIYREADLRERFLEANKRKAERYSSDHMTRQYLRIYDQLLGERDLEIAAV